MRAMSKLLKNIVGNIKRPTKPVMFLICCCAVGIALLFTRYMAQAPLSPDVLVTLNGKPFLTTHVVSQKIDMEKKQNRVLVSRDFALRVFDTTCLSMLTDEWFKQNPFCNDCKKRRRTALCEDCKKRIPIKNQLELDYDKETYFIKHALKASTSQESLNRSQRLYPGHSLLLEYLDEIQRLFNIKILKEHLATFLEQYPGSFKTIPQLADVRPTGYHHVPFLPQPDLKP